MEVAESNVNRDDLNASRVQTNAPPTVRKSYKALSIFQASRMSNNLRSEPASFDPPPRVNSCLVTMKWRRTLGVEQTA